MSKSCCFLIAILLAVFAFNQVILPNLLSEKDRAALCDPLEKTAEESFAAPEFKLKESSVAYFIPLFASVQQTNDFSFPGQAGHFKGQPPHGNHVPIYIDERVLRI